ncbi:CheR family methyltransferase [Chitinimonas taiwanensis]|uniref:Chemotaxis protein methyltransferase CheR n=1 Tax=Chitinimonas taiwanensis DSM 18899 TaxID=1121279 RepID=A0A1K2HS10_9NEIS|nr:CheR family methyltransferase [Chitinimonas taiwanensis]SFZ79485.1 chemotaxis protein methyltransferase CheR [Chitinimonas taiwanensis DSM 18899]
MHSTEQRPLSPVRLQALAEQIGQALGLDFQAGQLARLQAALWQADQGGYALPAEPAALSSAQLAELCPYLVVGETYFQRDPSTWQEIGQQLLLPLLEQRAQQGERRLRLWSAACCSGEEAYTLLFLLDELLGAALDDWQIELLGSDLNPAFIAQARAGRYGPYAFRQSSPGWRERYFVAEGPYWRVAPRWRSRIRFAVHNLADAAPSPAPAGFDLILCRNVLMYLTPEAIRNSLARLQAQLQPEGSLLLSAAEAGLAVNAGYSGQMLGLAYRIAAPGAPAQTAPLLPTAAPVRPIPRRQAAAPPVLRSAPQAVALPAGQPARPDPLQGAQQLADQGRWCEAEACCRLALQRNPCDGMAYWLLALVHDGSNQLEAALHDLHKLSYLEPDWPLTPYLEAQIQLRRSQPAQARRAQARCLQLLDRLEDSSLITHGDGLNAHQLRRLCQALETDTR